MNIGLSCTPSEEVIYTPGFINPGAHSDTNDALAAPRFPRLLYISPDPDIILRKTQKTKNLLLTSHNHFRDCPHPVQIPGFERLSRCKKPSCPICGPRQARTHLNKFRLRLGAERAAELWDSETPGLRWHFVTLRLPADNSRWLGSDPRLWAPASLKLMEGVGAVFNSLRTANKAADWPGVKLDYLSVIHFQSPHQNLVGAPLGCKNAFVAHVHAMVCEYADTNGQFQTAQKFRSRLCSRWNASLRKQFEILRRPDASSSDFDAPGLVYCRPCIDPVTSLAYMLWEHGRPWQRDHWFFPLRSRRINMSHGFFTFQDTGSFQDAEIPQDTIFAPYIDLHSDGSTSTLDHSPAPGSLPTPDIDVSAPALFPTMPAVKLTDKLTKQLAKEVAKSARSRELLNSIKSMSERWPFSYYRSTPLSYNMSNSQNSNLASPMRIEEILPRISAEDMLLQEYMSDSSSIESSSSIECSSNIESSSNGSSQNDDSQSSLNEDVASVSSGSCDLLNEPDSVSSRSLSVDGESVENRERVENREPEIAQRAENLPEAINSMSSSEDEYKVFERLMNEARRRRSSMRRRF